MKTHSISLNALLSEGGVKTELKNNLLYMITTKTIQPTCGLSQIPINSYLYLPDTYKLPLRIDLTFSIDAPELYLMLGNGHVNVGSGWSTNRRIRDILEPSTKTRFYDNRIPMNEFVTISIIYGLKAMMFLINDEVRYYSQKESYMKSELLYSAKEQGLKLRISSSKNTITVIKSITVTEYDELEIPRYIGELPRAVTRNEAIALNEKPTFEACISLLPTYLKDEIRKTDEYIRKLKSLKLKRKVEENKITYVSSDYGFSYTMFISNDLMSHSLNWYVIHNHTYKFKEKDYMPEVLYRLKQISPEFAEKMFDQLRECASIGCMDTKIYDFNGCIKKTCNGRIEFKMCLLDFEDARTFISVVNQLEI